MFHLHRSAHYQLLLHLVHNLHYLLHNHHLEILVLYYSGYGHTEVMAKAVAEGAGAVDGVNVTIKTVPELVPEEVLKASGMKTEPSHPIADPNELGDYDGIIFGVFPDAVSYTGSAMILISAALLAWRETKRSKA